MSETKHTPPPWHVVQSDKLLYVCDAAGNSIPQSWATDPIAVANAHKIAAAPETPSSVGGASGWEGVL